MFFSKPLLVIKFFFPCWSWAQENYGYEEERGRLGGRKKRGKAGDRERERERERERIHMRERESFVCAGGRGSSGWLFLCCSLGKHIGTTAPLFQLDCVGSF
jgi:hypothetical protein